MTNQIRSNRLGFIVSVRTLANIHEMIRKLSDIILEDDFLLIVNQSEEKLYVNHDISRNQNIKVIDSATTGLSRGRNVGIEYLLRNSVAPDGLLFPNDLSSYPLETIKVARKHLESTGEAIIVGCWKSEIGVDLLTPFARYVDSRHVMRAYEPAILFPIGIFKAGLRFDEAVGSGALSPFQSGEGTHLLNAALNIGIVILGDKNLVCLNPSTKRNLTKKQYLRKSFFYGAGTGHYLHKNFWKINPLKCFGLLFAPLVGYLIGKPYWRTQGFSFTTSNCIGRTYGLIIF